MRRPVTAPSPRGERRSRHVAPVEPETRRSGTDRRHRTPVSPDAPRADIPYGVPARSDVRPLNTRQAPILERSVGQVKGAAPPPPSGGPRRPRWRARSILGTCVTVDTSAVREERKRGSPAFLFESKVATIGLSEGLRADAAPRSVLVRGLRSAVRGLRRARRVRFRQGLVFSGSAFTRVGFRQSRGGAPRSRFRRTRSGSRRRCSIRTSADPAPGRCRRESRIRWTGSAFRAARAATP